jgi:hypothetical protein
MICGFFNYFRRMAENCSFKPPTCDLLAGCRISESHGYCCLPGNCGVARKFGIGVSVVQRIVSA